MTAFTVGRVLIVDDEHQLLVGLCETLRKAGYETAGASSGEEALSALKEREFDLLLADLMMPGMDGIALLQAALAIDERIIGIIMTGYGTVKTAVDALKMGAFDFILKPFKINSLLPVLSRAIEVRRLRLENVQLHETMAINELSMAIALTLDTGTILGRIADGALKQLEGDEVSIMLPTEDGDALYVAAVGGGSYGHFLGEQIPLDQGVAGWVAKNREPLLLHGRVIDPRFSPIHPREDIQSSISMPMIAGGKLVGVVNLNATRRRHPFTLGQMRALNILVSMAAPAVENARLYERLLAAEENYRSIVENAVEGIFQSTPEGRFLTVNPALARMTGYDSPEELMASVTDIGGQLYVDPSCWAECVRLVQEHRVASQFETQICSKDRGAIWISQNVHAVYGASGSLLHYEGTIEDITGRKQSEERLRKLQQQFHQSQKMEAVGQLAGGVAHDFNNLLTIINGYTQFLLTSLDDNDPRRVDVQEIKKASDRAAALTRQLLSFSRHQTMERRILNLNDVVTNLEKMLRRLIGEDIDLVILPAPDLGLTNADPGQMEQIIVNLAVNARDAMASGGQLRIETRNATTGADAAKTQAEIPPGSYVKLTVTDTGAGMSEEVQSRIFDPFFTTKEQGKGTGLGLSVVYGIVQQSEGYIDVHSEEGQGTTFEILLPRVEDSEEAMTGSVMPGGSPGGTETILVAEDDEMIRSIAVRTLTGLGYRALAAPNGSDAIRLCEQDGDAIHLLLTDVVMPGMNGRELAEQLTAQRSGLKVIYMSGYTDDSMLKAGVSTSRAPFLQKPFTAEGLALKVRAVLDS